MSLPLAEHFRATKPWVSRVPDIFKGYSLLVSEMEFIEVENNDVYLSFFGEIFLFAFSLFLVFSFLQLCYKNETQVCMSSQ